jgi:hypothetical protein
MRLNKEQIDTALKAINSNASSNNTKKKIARGLITKGIVNKTTRLYQDEKSFIIRDYEKLRTIRTNKGYVTSFLRSKFNGAFDKAWLDDVPALIEVYAPKGSIGIAKDDMTINICHTPNIDKTISPILDEVEIPKHFKILLDNIFPVKEEQEYFLHWLANSLQFNINRVAIVSQGATEGTGKGLFFSEFVRWAFSEENVGEILMRNIKSQFNDVLGNKLFVVMNEIRFTSRENATQEEIKAWITDDFIQVERKGRDVRSHKRLMSFWLHTNQAEPMVLNEHDRRFNIFETSRKKLTEVADVELLVEHLKEERKALLEQLLALKVNKKLISTPLVTAAKVEVIKATEGQHLEFARLIMAKDMFAIADYANSQFNRPKTERERADQVSLLNNTTISDLLSKLEYEIDSGKLSVSLLHHLHCLLFKPVSNRVMNKLYSETFGSKAKPIKKNGKVFRGFIV